MYKNAILLRARQYRTPNVYRMVADSKDGFKFFTLSFNKTSHSSNVHFQWQKASVKEQNPINENR